MMTILTIASILLVISFLEVAIGRKGELPESISALVYALPKRWQWTWIVWMWVVAITTCIPLISVLGDGLDVLGFVTLACLVWCGGMPISNKDVTLPHCVAGIGAGIVSQVCVLLICPWWLLAWIVMAGIIGVVAFFKSEFALINDSEEMPVILDGKGVLLAEGICYVSMIGSVLTKLYNYECI